MTDRASAACLAVGDELLAGAHPDLNSPFVAARLAELGRRADEVALVRDDEQAIADALGRLCARYPLVVASGGLGPTLDDVTRHGAARAAGVPLEHSDEAWSQIEAWYTRAGRAMPDSNRRQALLPRGAHVVHNAYGTAPGFRMRLGDSTLFVLPGPPHELQGVFADAVEPWLAEHPAGDEAVHVGRLHISDLSESVFADQVGVWMQRDTNPLIGVTAQAGVLSVRVVARGPDRARAQALAEERLAELEALFGARVFSRGTADPAFALGERLLERGLTVTCAESCTGGLVASRLTRVPGISAVFRESFVTYSDEAKERALGVPRALIEAHGAVSAEVAEAMARGAAERAGARLAVGVTGVAGPDGGSADKPVGLVWFGIALDGALRSVERRWPAAGRDRVREWASTFALTLLLAEARSG